MILIHHRGLYSSKSHLLTLVMRLVNYKASVLNQGVFKTYINHKLVSVCK